MGQISLARLLLAVSSLAVAFAALTAIRNREPYPIVIAATAIFYAVLMLWPRMPTWLAIGLLVFVLAGVGIVAVVLER